jgi:hypothetical protein
LRPQGNVITTFFIFWRLDEKKGNFLQLSLSSGDLLKKEMFLQLPLTSGDIMNKENFLQVFLFLET